ncbi:hypothetical protein ABN763_14745 [Spongiivirga sp. MCCC 1A20706]|uniref:hypothetical protein n=1 Tax=Spongiivirga sp. MCCC 1A20706 TaxID=3160963 RepID=UPI00397763D5
MNISDFTYLLKEPDAINTDQTEAIESIIKEYPYFQAARAIFLKGLKNQDSFRYNDQLKVTAAHTTDRTVLFDFITSEAFKKSVVLQASEEKDPLDIEVNEFEELAVETENRVTEVIKTAADVVDTGTEAVINEENHLQEKTIPVSQNHEVVEKVDEEVKKITTNKTALQVDAPLEFDKNERHSFNEWLQLSTIKPIDRSEEKTTKESSQRYTEEENITETKAQKNTPTFEEKLTLIDRFIEKNPKIRPVKENIPIENLAEGNLVDRNELMTETLAKVYLAQKKYKKAIQAYKILSLKYPEKNSFFADRILEIKKIKKNN